MSGRVFSKKERFKFSCHSGLSCFTRCCRDVNIFLSPYDVLRMKRKLGMTSGEFLARYTVRLTTQSGYPLLLLKMQDDEEKRCPFVTPQGCRIYSDRPWSCRMAPVEVLGEEEYGFILDSNFCKGFNEDVEWTLEDWMRDQGLHRYDEVEKLFKEIPLLLASSGKRELDGDFVEKFFTACYDIDRFRATVLEGGMFESDLTEIGEDEEELLKFAFQWVTSQFALREK